MCAVAVGAGTAAAGLTSGHAACLDARTGAASAMWRAHQAAVSALTVLDDYHILTASQVTPWPCTVCCVSTACKVDLRYPNWFPEAA